MKLLYSPFSPFVRKVMIVAIEHGLDGKIEKVTEATNPSVPNPNIAKHNPLMKIPALVTDDGLELIESKVIVQYLDSLGGGKLIPASGKARWKALRTEAIADGLADAGILVRYEVAMRYASLKDRPTPNHSEQALDFLKAVQFQLQADRLHFSLGVGIDGQGGAGLFQARQPVHCRPACDEIAAHHAIGIAHTYGRDRVSNPDVRSRLQHEFAQVRRKVIELVGVPVRGHSLDAIGRAVRILVPLLLVGQRHGDRGALERGAVGKNGALYAVVLDHLLGRPRSGVARPLQQPAEFGDVILDNRARIDEAVALDGKAQIRRIEYLAVLRLFVGFGQILAVHALAHPCHHPVFRARERKGQLMRHQQGQAQMRDVDPLGHRAGVGHLEQVGGEFLQQEIPRFVATAVLGSLLEHAEVIALLTVVLSLGGECLTIRPLRGQGRLGNRLFVGALDLPGRCVVRPECREEQVLHLGLAIVVLRRRLDLVPGALGALGVGQLDIPADMGGKRRTQGRDRHFYPLALDERIEIQKVERGGYVLEHDLVVALRCAVG